MQCNLRAAFGKFKQMRAPPLAPCFTQNQTYYLRRGQSSIQLAFAAEWRGLPK